MRSDRVYDQLMSDESAFAIRYVFMGWCNVLDMFNRARTIRTKKERNDEGLRTGVNHGETQLIIARGFSHGKNISRSKEISDDTGRSTQGGRRKVGRDTGTKVLRFVIE